MNRDLSEAVFAPPNNTIKISDVNKLDVPVKKGEVLDGVGRHYSEKVRISDESAVNVAKVLAESKADVLLNYLPLWVVDLLLSIMPKNVWRQGWDS